MLESACNNHTMLFSELCWMKDCEVLSRHEALCPKACGTPTRIPALSVVSGFGGGRDFDVGLKTNKPGSEMSNIKRPSAGGGAFFCVKAIIYMDLSLLRSRMTEW